MQNINLIITIYKNVIHKMTLHRIRYCQDKISWQHEVFLTTSDVFFQVEHEKLFGIVIPDLWNQGNHHNFRLYHEVN